MDGWHPGNGFSFDGVVLSLHISSLSLSSLSYQSGHTQNTKKYDPYIYDFVYTLVTTLCRY
jgi:hypothetical protein